MNIRTDSTTVMTGLNMWSCPYAYLERIQSCPSSRETSCSRRLLMEILRDSILSSPFVGLQTLLDSSWLLTF
jgi:hypothetical protein